MFEASKRLLTVVLEDFADRPAEALLDDGIEVDEGTAEFRRHGAADAGFADTGEAYENERPIGHRTGRHSGGSHSTEGIRRRVTPWPAHTLTSDKLGSAAGSDEARRQQDDHQRTSGQGWTKRDLGPSPPPDQVVGEAGEATAQQGYEYCVEHEPGRE